MRCIKMEKDKGKGAYKWDKAKDKWDKMGIKVHISGIKIKLKING